jgi:hypothetical protein
MPVVVTADACAVQSKICSTVGSRNHRQNLRTLDVLSCMAVLASDGRVFPGTLKASYRMIECALVKQHRLCIPSQMFFVACDAFLR